MTYLLLNLGFFAIVGLVVVAAIFTRRAPRWRIVGLSAIPLVVLTAIFDNVLVGTGIVAYDPSRISGAYLGFAPVEDFSYAIAAVVLLPCLWTLLAPRARAAQSGPTP
ncbi:MAG: lycopene cyclase domain-containing protein [Actinomycetota bacterium]|nr:lycopene cyclase domain-containing protein [Actinomycetota bacterium]